MPSLALACRLSAATVPQPLPRRVRNILSKYGASLLIPGAGEPVLGPNVLENGTFDSAAGWTLGPEWSISGGVASASANTTEGLRTTTASIVAGKTYQIEFDKTGSFNCVLICGGVTALSTTASGRLRTNATIGSGSTRKLDFYLAGVGTIDNVVVREILGYNNTYFTFNSGNYVESTGQTLTPVDGAVGLAVDAAGVLGENVVDNFNSLGAGWEWSGGELTHSAGSGSRASDTTAVQANKAYLFTYTVKSSNTGGALSVEAGTFKGVIAPSVVGTHTVFVQAETTNSSASFHAASGLAITISNISVRELPGIHAIQATSQNKPALRKGLVNQLLWSSDFANSGWIKLGDTTATSTRITFPTGTALNDVRRSFTIPAGVYTFAMDCALISGTPNGSVDFNNVNTAAFVVPVERGLVVRQITATEARTWLDIGMSGPAVIDVFAAALFQGTVTAEQILAAGGIPVTTTAPASSAIGPQYWQFDGTDDRLQLSAVPFQMSDDFAIVAATYCDPVSTSSWNSVFAASGTSDTARIQLAIESASGAITFFCRDDVSTSVSTRYAGANFGLRQSRVISAVKRGNRRSIRYDGVETPAVTNQQLGATTFQGANIGKLWSGTDYFDGDFHAIALIKGNPTDAELLTLERFLATLQGRRI